MKRLIAVAIIFCATALAAQDLTVTIKAVNMETSSYTTADSGGRTYNWHSMLAEVDGVTYKIGNDRRIFEHWLHKGDYTGRWANSKHTKLEVDYKDGGKVKHYEFHVLGEE